MLSRSAILLMCLATSPLALAQNSRDFVYVVGSSTVYPFATVMAERFGRSTDFKTPKVESTGSGGGFKLFCDGLGVNFPDVTNASRKIKRSELEACRRNGVRELIEVKIGYDGIVIASTVDSNDIELTLREIFLALAKEVPGEQVGTLVANPHRRWSDIDARLPEAEIEVYGPPPTSGTRDELVEQIMEAGCDTFDDILELKRTDPSEHQRICQSVREDGAYIEAGENDNLIVQKLQSNQRAFGIFGYSFLDQNLDKIKGASLNGVEPSFDSISARDYPVTRALYFYVKKAHVDVIPGLPEFLVELTSERAWGDEGYLSDRGLIPMPADERLQVAERVRALSALPLAKN